MARIKQTARKATNAKTLTKKVLASSGLSKAPGAQKALAVKEEQEVAHTRGPAQAGKKKKTVPVVDKKRLTRRAKNGVVALR